MTKLEELNIYKSNDSKPYDLNKIINKAIKSKPYSDLIGKCFVSNHSKNSYKILNIESLEPDGRIITNSIICQSDEIYQYKKIHDADNVTEITSKKFEANLIQACNNMK